MSDAKLGGRLAGLLFFLALLFGATSARAQMPALLADSTAAEHAVPVRELLMYAGVTVCDGERAASFIRAELVGTPYAAVVLAHEAKHREQMAREGCEAFYRRYRTTEGMLDAEAEAYQAGACVLIAQGNEAQSVRATFIRTLFLFAARRASAGDVVAAFARYTTCP